MMPFYFGSESRRLFGVYEAAVARPRSSAALICYPWGSEYIHAHRAMRRLSTALAGTGRHTLRFDYFGTGDSGGETSEGDLAGWREDVDTAFDEILDMSQASRVTIIGLRMGATLAAEIAANRGRAVENLVLWDPVVAGSDYIKDLHDQADAFVRRKGIKREPRRSGQGGGREVLGFCLTEALESEIRALDLERVVPRLPKRTLIIETQVASGRTSLDEIMTRAERLDVHRERMESSRPWLEDLSDTAGAIPVNVIEQIVTWCG
jgi:pimeloyl-ACP methyl ester carboxylesterase